MDGLAIMRHLRAANDKTLVLMLTARDAVEDRVEGLESGADDYLVKPFAPAELLARLSAVIRSCEGCENVTVIEVTRLDTPDTAGCNWSSSVVLDPAGVAPEVYALAYASVVFMARSSLNLK